MALHYFSPDAVSALPFLPGCWFPGSAWEPTGLEALPYEAEPLAQCVPRQSLGTRCTRCAETVMHPEGGRLPQSYAEREPFCQKIFVDAPGWTLLNQADPSPRSQRSRGPFLQSPASR